MDPLPDLAAAFARWLAGPVLPLLTLVAGYVGARLLGADRRHPAGRRAGPSAAPPATAGTEAADVGGAPVGQTEMFEMQTLLGRLEQENRYLEQALAHRGADIQLLTARMGEAAARDREELVHLQEELETEHRLGVEKARLIRSLEAAVQRAEARLQEVHATRERQRVSLAALQAALVHAKRAQASTEGRLARLREQLRLQAAPTAGHGEATERIVERIVEIPVETIVYRDREVPVEVPIEVPVGFTVLPVPASSTCGRGTPRTGRAPPDAARR